MGRRNYLGLAINAPLDDLVTHKERHVSNYVRYMLARTQTMFEYEGLPQKSNQSDRITFSRRELELQLQYNGYTCVLEQDGKLYCTFAGLGGEPDAYYMPSQIVVSNPRLKSQVLNIGENCVVIPNDDLYIGLRPMYIKYANLLTDADITLRLHDINTRLPSLISADDDNTAASAKEFLKQLNRGEMGVIADNAFLESLKVNPYSASSYGTITDNIEYRQYLLANWYNELGLQANYNMKRERLNDDEVAANAGTLLPLMENMLECRRIGVNAINEMFDTNISVSYASAWEVTVREIEQMLQDAPEEGDDAGGEKDVNTDRQTEETPDVD